jgi:hypothetical protein
MKQGIIKANFLGRDFVGLLKTRYIDLTVPVTIVTKKSKTI